MIPFFIILIFAITQGLCEFLPISSSGHLYLLYDIFNITNNTLLITIVLHIATLISLIIYYRKEILMLIKNPFCNTNKKIVVSTIFTLITIIPMYSLSKIFVVKETLLFSFGATAILLLIADYLSNTRYNLSNICSIYSTITNINLSYRQAIFIGISQGIAIIPGMSRSGTTIATGIISGVDKDIVSKYSFLISIPIVIASGIMQIIDIIVNTPSLNFDIASIVICFIVCLAVGLLAIKLCTKIVNSNKLYIFSYYLIGLIILILILMFI